MPENEFLVTVVDERKLEKHERPLYVQLNWGKDDREGRFLLKRVDLKTAPVSCTVYLNPRTLLCAL